MVKNVLKTTLRSILSNPLHSTINILGLTVGLAAVLLLLNWINYHNSFDRYHSQSDNIYKVIQNDKSSTGDIVSKEEVQYNLLGEAQSNVSGIGNMTRVISSWRWPSKLCFKNGQEGECLYQNGIYADSSFFKIFDITIVKGASNPLLAPNHIAISESMAKDWFGDIDPIGATYKLDTWLEVEVVSLFEDIPANSSLKFDFIAPLKVALSLMGQKDQMQSLSYITYLTLNTNSKENIGKQLNQLIIDDKNQNASLYLLPLTDQHLYSSFENGLPSDGLITYIQIFLLFIVFILFMSAINFVNLSTAKASNRGKEIGIRKVTGASRESIMFQFLFEGLLKVVLATSLGLLIAHQLSPLTSYYLQENVPFIIDKELLLSLSLIILLCTGLSAGYPALIMSKYNPVMALKNKGNLYSGPQGLRKWLTVFQISFSVTIILVTSVMYMQINFLKEKNLGYDREGVMLLEPTWQHIKNFDSFKNQLLESHLIINVGAANQHILNVTSTTDNFSWPGKVENEKINFKLIGGEQGFVETLGMKLLAGKGFSDTDSSEQILLSKGAVELMMLQEPIGAELSIYNEKLKVVGIVDDFVNESLHSKTIPTIIYKIPARQSGTVYIRYDKNASRESIAHIQKVYDNHEKFFSMRFSLLDEEYEKQYKNEQVLSKISTFIMAVAIIIALVGILGLSTYNLVKRYKEIGIRKVFGASVTEIITLLSRDFVIITVIANIIAWPAAYYISDLWLGSFAYHIEVPYHIFLLGFLLIIISVVVLISLQTMKAAMMNPATVIKDN